VVQLHRIIALRSCGLSLEEIGTTLSSEASGGLADLLRRQLGWSMSTSAKRSLCGFDPSGSSMRSSA
jgi:hypothetical protein